MKTSAETAKPLFFIKKLKKPGKQFFWAWIAYQTAKGLLTTTVIWIPLLYSVWPH